MSRRLESMLPKVNDVVERNFLLIAYSLDLAACERGRRWKFPEAEHDPVARMSYASETS